MDRIWTPEQQNCIDASGGTVLVSAAAGSGKTAVIVQRIIRKITDNVDITPADSIVVVTFTLAAANEIRSRIAVALMSELEKNPNSEFLINQQKLLARAHIGTIDSYCAKIVQDYYYKIGLNPDFKMADETQVQSLMDRSFDTVLNANYEREENKDFIHITNLLSFGRTDTDIKEIVFSLINYARSHPFSRQWIADKSNIFEKYDSLEQSPWGKIVISTATQYAGHAKHCFEMAIDTAMENEQTTQNYVPVLKDDINNIEKFLDVISSDWDRAKKNIESITYGKLKAVRGEDKPIEIISAVQEYRKDAKSFIEKITKLFVVTASEFKEDAKYLENIANELVRFTLEFWDEFTKSKRENNLCDFNDIIEFTTEILLGTDNEKTKECMELSESISEIMIDEYQDTNKAQNMIFSALSKDEKNLFFVGDIKQSIYMFRQAMPEMFARKKREFSKYDGENFPAVISLDRNFRSRPGVINFCNYVFGDLMTEKLGGIEYKNSEELVFGLTPEEDNNGSANLFLVEKSSAMNEIESQARIVANEIIKLKEKGYEYSDFCIMLRSMKNNGGVISRILREYGIPAVAKSSESVFESAEVRMLIDILTAINNPLLDIPLASALTTPVFKFTLDDLLDIRANSTGKNLYTSMLFAEDEKCKEAIAQFKEFRKLSVKMPMQSFVEYIIQNTGYLAIISTMENKETRIANLRSFISFIAEFQRDASNQLSDLISYIKYLEDKDIVQKAASGGGESGSVNISTIHGSKGLEYPVCFVINIEKRFNLTDAYKKLITDSELGLASGRMNTEMTNSFKTLQLTALSLKKAMETRSEEMRLLYVALTRARNHIYLVGVDNIKWQDETVSGTRDTASSYLKWLSHTNGPELSKLCNIRFFSDEDINLPDIKPVEERRIDEELESKIIENLSYKYKYQEATKLPSKMSVTEIAKNETDRFLFSAVPEFLAKAKSGADKGTAMHKYLQFADVTAEIPNEIERLKVEGVLTQSEIDLIDISDLEIFKNSEVAKIIESSKKVLREHKFITAKEMDGEEMIVQGIIDLLCISEDKAYVIDYKTDGAKTEDYYVKNYKAQILLYKDAVIDTMGIKDVECIIYSTKLGKEIYL